MTTQHTPTPWMIEPQAEVSAHRIVDATGVPIADVRIIGRSEGGAGTREHAAFIVKACNAHDELVAALVKAKYVLAHLSLDQDCTEGQPEALVAARAALAKVQS